MFASVLLGRHDILNAYAAFELDLELVERNRRITLARFNLKEPGATLGPLAYILKQRDDCLSVNKAYILSVGFKHVLVVAAH
ncbi:MAG: hypothetical protein RR477_09050, partial [Raoultibacter sp.]